MRVSGEARGSQVETILHPGARWLIATWVKAKGAKPRPDRADVDLAQVPRLAPWLFIAEATPAGGYGYRLAGTGLCGFLGREVTGTDLLAGWDLFESGVIDRALRSVVRRNRLAHLRLRFLTDRGETVGADMPALPMTARDGTVHVLGGLFPHADPKLWTYGSLAPVEVAAARVIDPKRQEIAAEDPQGRRKFRVISGGLDID